SRGCRPPTRRYLRRFQRLLRRDPSRLPRANPRRGRSRRGRRLRLRHQGHRYHRDSRSGRPSSGSRPNWRSVGAGRLKRQTARWRIAAPVAAERARPSNDQAGPVIMSASIRFRRRTSMNDARCKEIQRALTLIGEAKGILELALSQEQDDLDNMPEDLQGDEEGQIAEDMVEA